MKLGARELREVDEVEVQKKPKKIKRRPIYFVLENIYDTYNVGGLFRLADALAIEKIYLVGETETPPNSRIKKASIGTYKVVPWAYKKTTTEVFKELKKEVKGIKFYAVEQDPNSKPFNKVNFSYPAAFIVGNETSGVLPETLKSVDQVVEIPMWGINKSLNVIVSAAIVAYTATNQSADTDE